MSTCPEAREFREVRTDRLGLRKIRGSYVRPRILRLPVGQALGLDSVGINRREVVNERVTQERSSEPS
jgi:hypothetical protein